MRTALPSAYTMILLSYSLKVVARRCGKGEGRRKFMTRGRRHTVKDCINIMQGSCTEYADRERGMKPEL